MRVTGNPGRDSASVITLDDISDLVAAQRTAAWADVARRIAHEIKNPLTPIQLSAERLKRRYGRHIIEGKDVFDQCTDTIIRQVGTRHQAHGRRILVVCTDAQGAHGARRPDRLRAPGALPHASGPRRHQFEERLPDTAVFADFDRRLISQALTNVLKNASEEIDALGNVQEKGKVLVSLDPDVAGFIEIAVSDNGKSSRTRIAGG